ARLDAQRESARTAARSAAFYFDLCHRFEPFLYGTGSGPYYQQLELEHPNLRATLQWALDTASVDAGMQLLTGTQDYWHARRFTREASGWANQLFEHPAAVQAAARGPMLNAAIGFARRRAEYDMALRLSEQAKELFELTNDRIRLGSVYINLGGIAEEGGDWG